MLNTASKNAATINNRPTTIAAVTALNNNNIRINEANEKPSNAANFLGGANTCFGFTFAFCKIVFPIKANGDNPFVNARIAKSTTKKTAIIQDCNSSNMPVKTSTCAATNRMVLLSLYRFFVFVILFKYCCQSFLQLLSFYILGNYFTIFIN